MRKWNSCLILIGSIATIIDIGCKKKDADITQDIINVNENNRPPIANAGLDKTIRLPVNMITLDASASTDPDNNLSSYTWKKITGPTSFIIQNPTSAQTTVNNLSLGEYHFELTVTDSKGATTKDTCSVLVLAPIENNRPPIANAGADITIYVTNNTAILDGTASTDADNNISGYAWKQISGPASFTIQDSTAVRTTVTNLSLGEYRFELTVTDSIGSIAKDTCSVLVLAPQLYLYVSAHPLYSLLTATGNTSTILSGSAWINGLPANIASKEWKEISGPVSCVINSPSSFETLVTGLTRGVYQFQFKAITVNGLSDSARVTVAVIDPLSPNQEVILQNQQWNYGLGFSCHYLYFDLDQYLPPGTPVKKIFIKPDCTSVWHELVMVSANTNNEAYSYQILNGHFLDVEWCNSGCNYLDSPDLKIIY